MKIQKAERKAVKIKLAITGPSGAGKTMSSLLLAKGIVGEGKILVIDTEDGSSNLYADHQMTDGIDYDVLEIEAPYTVDKYVKALQMGQAAGYGVIIIDSISHEWDGQGGLLEKKTAIDSRGGNSYANWKTVSKEHELFKASIVHSPCHIIATMRSKSDIVQEVNDKGKMAPKKVGLKPIQREGMEYEFSTVFDLGMDHQFTVSKDRTGLFEGVLAKIGLDTGKKIADWLSSGKEIQSPLPQYVSHLTVDQAQELRDLIKEACRTEENFCKFYKISSLEFLPIKEYENAKSILKKAIEKNRLIGA